MTFRPALASVSAARWFPVVLVLALLTVSFAALVPHHETEDASCTVCKIGSQPFEASQAVTAPIVDPAAKGSPVIDDGANRPAVAPADTASRAPPV